MLCPTQLRSTVYVFGVPNVCCVANREVALFLSLDKISIIRIHNMVEGCFSSLFYLFNFHLLAVLNTDTTGKTANIGQYISLTNMSVRLHFRGHRECACAQTRILAVVSVNSNYLSLRDNHWHYWTLKHLENYLIKLWLCPPAHHSKFRKER